MKQVFTTLALIAVLTGGMLSSCSLIDNQSSGSSNSTTQSGKVLIEDRDIAKYPMDPVMIKDASVIGDSLTMLVSYSGGCKPHDFKVVWNGAMMKSLPGQINVVLSHNANDDMCEALITQDVTVSLAPIKQHATNGVVIHLKGFDKPLLYKH
ncbi:MAG TPA: NigD-like C-terminal domain-containing protein [Candidatus Kapabacteria bacterium]|nr:NigD-like C-terminal domain-containing protein [Candidatus Kapabacteria bacterium]